MNKLKSLKKQKQKTTTTYTQHSAIVYVYNTLHNSVYDMGRFKTMRKYFHEPMVKYKCESENVIPILYECN